MGQTIPMLWLLIPISLKDQMGKADDVPGVHEESSLIAKKVLDRVNGENYLFTYDSQVANYPLAEQVIDETLRRAAV